MLESKKFKDRVIFALIVVIFVMIAAIVVLAQNNITLINGVNGGDGAIWKVEFTDVKEVERVGNAINKRDPQYTVTLVSFDVEFLVPGDSLTYEVKMKNDGKLDAVLSKIDRLETEDVDIIQYYVDGMEEGEILKSGEEKTIRVKVVYEKPLGENKEVNKAILLSFNFEQAK